MFLKSSNMVTDEIVNGDKITKSEIGFSCQPIRAKCGSLTECAGSLASSVGKGSDALTKGVAKVFKVEMCYSSNH